MGFRGVGGRGARARLRAALAALLAAGVVASGGIGLGAREALSALDYQATVLNQGIVGSAFALAEGLAVTNGHVVRGLGPGAAVTLVAPDRASFTAWVVAVSPRMDLAVLRIPADRMPVVGAENAPETGGLDVLAGGIDASGEDPGPRMELAGEVVVARTDIPAFGPGLIASVPGVRPGFSGGPMLDRLGRLVGMITAIRPGGNATRASGFAPAGRRGAEEAYVLRSRAIRAEVARLLAGLR